VLVLIAVLLTGSVLIWMLAVARPGEPVLTPRLHWWALLPLVTVAEVAVVHVQVRREAQAISMSEIPLVLCLFLATPADMAVAVVLGAGVVYVLLRRQSALKSLFNLTLRVFGVSLVLFLFQVVAGAGPASAPRSWLAAIVAVAAAGAVDGVLVLGVVAMHEGSVDGHDLRRELLTYPPVSAVVGTIGVLAVTALHADPRNAVPLVVVGAALSAGYRAYAALNDRHVSLARLYDFGRSVSEAHEVPDVVASVLSGARELLRAEAAEVVLVGAGPDGAGQRWVLAEGESVPRSHPVGQPGDPAVWESVLAGEGALLMRRRHRNGLAGDQLSALGYHEAVVVPLQDESGVVGTLLVAQRMGQVRTFQGADVPMLETVANQAGLALGKGRLLDRLGHEARHDVLTGLANRAKLRDSLGDALAEIAQGGDGFAVMLLDLNGFKEVNDSLGHHNGDVLLIHVAGRLAEAAGADATVARLGGDEFCVLLPAVGTSDGARAAAERIHRAIAEPVVIEGVDVAVRASIGITLAPSHGQDATQLLRGADEAMYAAKSRDGGTRIHDDHSDTHPTPAGRTRLALLAELRNAISHGEITVYAQPQAHADTCVVYGAEALIRWDHPQLGVLPPAEFLPLAERHGLMPELTETVLHQAVAAAADWRAHGLDLSVSVNLSARSLADTRIVAAVESALRRHALPPSHLTLEITEDSVMGDPASAIALLETLRATGVRLSVDDFGTGYSSLSYLRRLPVHEVKIDRSFITHLTRDTENQLIVRSIIDLAANLSLHVTAEGVEDQDCWDRLAALGCTAVQGYHLARPLPLEELQPWLTGYQARLRTAQRLVPAAVPRLRVI
jgi:diguanylate cyclase (GGDEF)-like protein